MNAIQKDQTSLGNLKDTTVSSISNRPHNFYNIASHCLNFTTKPKKYAIQQQQATRMFKAVTILIHATEVICATFTENFVKWLLNVKVPNESF